MLTQDLNKGYKRKINFLTGYVIISSIVFSFFLLSSFDNKDEKINFEEITLKRLNLIGEDGNLRMVISNEVRQHPGRMNGKDFPKRKRPAGIIFFNNQGDECGGIIANVQSENGSTNSGMSFTMDNYHDDQVIQILNDETYENNTARIQRGLIINEFPIGSNINSRNNKFKELEKIKDPKERNEKMKELWNKEGSKRKLFLGQNKDNNSGLFLYDSNGKPKIKIYVDQNGSPKIEIIDNDGRTKNIIDIN